MYKKIIFSVFGIIVMFLVLHYDLCSAKEVLNVTGNRVTLKEIGKSLDGYPYVSFAGGCNFAGKEIYAVRAAKGHYTQAGDFGQILFYERKTSVFRKLDIFLDYDVKKYGELRDPNLSVSRDGARLYVTCFTSFDKKLTTLHHSIIFILDKSLKQINSIIVPNTVFWGNTLETPNGYLLHADYKDWKIHIYKSNKKIIHQTDPDLKMVKVATLKFKDKRICAEPTIGYYQNKLVCIAREQSAYPSSYSYTHDLEGIKGWLPLNNLKYTIHAPCIQPYSKEKDLLYSGSIINSDITGGKARKRMPYIGKLRFSGGKAEHVVGTLLDDKNAWGQNGFGGYTTLVNVDDKHFGIMYYNDTTKGKDIKEGLYFKLVDVTRIFNNYKKSRI